MSEAKKLLPQKDDLSSCRNAHRLMCKNRANRLFEQGENISDFQRNILQKEYKKCPYILFSNNLKK